jgi:hypothetical protein
MSAESGQAPVSPCVKAIAEGRTSAGRFTPRALRLVGYRNAKFVESKAHQA